MTELQRAASDALAAYPELGTGGRGVPEWLPVALEQTVRWLTLSYRDAGGTAGANTTRGYAVDLGVPRALQAWRPAPSGRGRPSPGPVPQSFLRWCAAYDVDPFTDLDVDLAHAWVRAARACGDSDATLHRRLGTVGAWYSAMRRRGLTDIVFADLVTRRDRARLHITAAPANPTVAVSSAVVRALRLVAGMDPSPQRDRNRLIVDLLPGTGLRAVELCALDLDDVHRSGPGGFPALHVLGKGGRRRWVRLDATHVALIDEYLPHRTPPRVGTDAVVVDSHRPGPAPEPLLTSSTGRRLTPQAVTAVLVRLAGLANPDSDDPAVAAAARTLADAGRLHPHRFRHAHAQQADEAGASVTAIRRQLGHASLTTTQIYLEHGDALRHSTSVVVADRLRS